ncbi:MAG: hypothetical protein QOH39_3009 [Verrucomicrobiota bacterium]
MISLATMIACAAATVANETIFPPVNDQTIVGVWEALLEPPPAPLTLFRMEISATGDSYLSQTTAGNPDFVLFKVVPGDSKISNGTIAFHFHQVSSGPGAHDLWIRGSGTATATQGFIKCGIGNGDVWFVKGNWTRDLAAASQKGEKEIQRQHSK